MLRCKQKEIVENAISLPRDDFRGKKELTKMTTKNYISIELDGDGVA